MQEHSLDNHFLKIFSVVCRSFFLFDRNFNFCYKVIRLVGGGGYGGGGYGGYSGGGYGGGGYGGGYGGHGGWGNGNFTANSFSIFLFLAQK